MRVEFLSGYLCLLIFFLLIISINLKFAYVSDHKRQLISFFEEIVFQSPNIITQSIKFSNSKQLMGFWGFGVFGFWGFGVLGLRVGMESTTGKCL